MTPTGRRRGLDAARWLRWAGLGCLLAATALLAPHLGSDMELVRLRTALVLGPDATAADMAFTPANWPADFARDRTGPDRYFAEVARGLDLAGKPDDWTRAVAIVRHLTTSAPTLVGDPLRSDLRGTHRGIVEQGRGYCGDFIRVFNALALAGGLQVRNWAFSFDGYGGHGHIWAEVWNRQLGRWQLFDVFNNFYYTSADGRILSALELREALARRTPGLALHKIVPEGRAGFEEEPKAWDYLQRGLPQWYVPWGVNPFDVDASTGVRLFTGLSRAAEQLATIASGRHPSVRILVDRDSDDAHSGMHRLQRRLSWALGLGVMALAALAAAAWLRRGRKAGDVAVSLPGAWPRLCLVGPLPPPSGGMANQCEQLLRLLRSEGVEVELVRTNAPYRPAFVGRIPMVRAGFRLLPYLGGLWAALGRAQVVHVFANSGWAWHLLAWPALLVARLRRVPAIVNYRGGLADEFLQKAPSHVHRALRGVSALVVPSPFLVRVFGRHRLAASIVPNIIDLSRFSPRTARAFGDAPHLIVTRNLEPIYDIGTAMKAFQAVKAHYRGARLTVAGSGPELQALQSLATELGLVEAVRFSGRIDNARIGELYADADLVLNPSTADNMPNSILEALASGVPVVSTDVGGIPDLVEHDQTALLVPARNPHAMAEAALRVLGDPALALRLRDNGVAEVQRYAWPQVREQWRQAYRSASRPRSPNAPPSIAVHL